MTHEYRAMTTSWTHQCSGTFPVIHCLTNSQRCAQPVIDWPVRKLYCRNLTKLKTQLTTLTSPSTIDTHSVETRREGALLRPATENLNCRLRAGSQGWASLNYYRRTSLKLGDGESDLRRFICMKDLSLVTSRSRDAVRL